MAISELLREFENRKPEIIYEWNDPLTEARGWIVINSLRGGAAGGGTRMRKGLDRREVESLAKTMEIKFTVAGPPIGGAKSGINFDPMDPRKSGVLKRWYLYALPLLKEYYGTGGDLFVDEIHEVIPVTRELGLLHPQEGVVNGHFKSSGKDREDRIRKLQEGVSLSLNNTVHVPVGSSGLKVADMITGYGVAQSVISYYKRTGNSVEGKRILVQGWGNVGAAAGYYLSKEGAQITGILDRNGGIQNNMGFSKDEIVKLFSTRSTNMFEGFTKDENINENFWNIPADVFIPAAASRLVRREQLENLKKGGVQIIACGANVPFADPEIFYGAIARYADDNFTVIPDFISNCGMARVFAYLMGNPPEVNADEIFNDVASVMDDAIHDVLKLHADANGFTAAGYQIALNKLIPVKE